MRIEELIEELQDALKEHGNVSVTVAASYDDGYAWACGNIQEIEFDGNTLELISNEDWNNIWN